MNQHIPTGSQTVGPFFNFGLTTDLALGILAKEGAEGERIRLELQVLDGDGAPANGDAMIELWQADSKGTYENGDPNFCGFGRLETGEDGTCVFETVIPGSISSLDAPHINVLVFARGLLRHLHTRIYFDGQPANASDPALLLVPEDRRHTIVAKLAAEGVWRLTIRLQATGAHDETVFFDL